MIFRYKLDGSPFEALSKTNRKNSDKRFSSKDKVSNWSLRSFWKFSSVALFKNTLNFRLLVENSDVSGLLDFREKRDSIGGASVTFSLISSVLLFTV